MLQIDTWKRALIWLVVAAGLLFAMPNAFYTRVEGHNDALAEIEVLGTTDERAAAIKAKLKASCRPMGDETFWGAGMPDWTRFKADDGDAGSGSSVDDLVGTLQTALQQAKSLR